MRLYADLSLLQDPAPTRDLLVHHYTVLLRHAREMLSATVEIIGIADGNLATLSPPYRDLVDRIQYAANPPRDGRPTILLHPNPASRAAGRMAPLLARSGVLSCAIIDDANQADQVPWQWQAPSRREMATWYSLKMYRFLRPISQRTADRLNQLLDIGPGRVQATGTCGRAAFTSGDLPPAKQGWRTRFEAGRFIVVNKGVAAVDQLGQVLSAHVRLMSDQAVPVGLVILDLNESERQKTIEFYACQGGAPKSIECPSEMSPQEVATLYRQSLATIHLCTGGFALSALEAITCGALVLASDSAPHRELLSPARGVFSSDLATPLEALLVRVSRDPEFRAELRAEQATAGSRFSEKEVAHRFWDSLRRLLPCTTTATEFRRKPRLAFLTPYPPDCSGVADFSAQSLRAMAQYASVDVYTSTQPRTDPWVHRFLPLSASAYLGDEYDGVVAVLGNSAAVHGPILELHNRWGGGCLFHDSRLVDLYVAQLGLSKVADVASRLLRRRVTPEEMQFWLDRPASLPTLFLDEPLASADPIFVHSRVLQNLLSQLYGRKANYLPFCCYRDFHERELSDDFKRAARTRLGIAANQLLIVSLGFVNWEKDPLNCIEALYLLRRQGIDAQLHFVGKVVIDQSRLETAIRKLKLTGQVRFLTTWVSDDLYRDYLAAADLAVQLRTHGFGGISGAVADCISAGLATVTTHDLATSIEAPDYVYPLPENTPAAQLPGQVAALLMTAYQSGRHRMRTSSPRSDYLRAHNFDRYAIELLHAFGISI